MPIFGEVESRDVYPGIDLVYYGNQRQLEYDFRVRPGHNPRAIRMAYSGIRGIHIEADGDLVLSTSREDIRQQRPHVYQELNGIQKTVSGRYKILAAGVVGFEVDSYDTRSTLIIDPILSYSSYIGGNKDDKCMGVGVDGAGNIYVGGHTTSPNLPVTKGAIGSAIQVDRDVFVAKYTAKGALVYLTYLGGNDTELMTGLSVDASGNVSITGTTASTNFPLANPIQAYNKGGDLGLDLFLSRLDPTGTQLSFSTYLGGNGDELPFGITADTNGNIYVTGITSSINYPVTSTAYQSGNRGILNFFVSKVNAPAASLVYSTYVGGRGTDVPGAIAVDSSGNAYIVGDTDSPNFPTTTNAVQTNVRGSTDVFVTKLNPNGSAVLYSTLLGGSAEDLGMGISVGSDGNIFVTGTTMSSDFPVTKGVLSSNLSGSQDAFVAKLDPKAGTLIYATYLGGTRVDSAISIAADSSGAAYVAGSTTSSNFPVAAAFQDWGGGVDGFVAKLDANGASVLQSSYLGRSGDEEINAMALDGSGNVYVVGDTTAVNFPTTSGAAQSTYGGGNSEGFLSVLNFAAAAAAISVTPNSLSFQGSAGGSIATQKLTINTAEGARTAWSAVATVTAGGAWLALNPSSGVGQGSITVTVTPGSLKAGSYTGSVTVTNGATGDKIAVPVSLALTDSGGQVPQNGVVSAASFQTGPVAPGEIVTIFGNGIGPSALAGTHVSNEGKLDVLISETRILFDGVAAPLLYVSANQSSAIVPYEVSGKNTTQLQVEYRNFKSNPLSLPVAACAPAIFTANSSGKGQGSIANQDYSVNSSGNPAAKGSVITFYATGEGQTDPGGVSGKVALDTYPKPVLPVSVQIGSAAAEVLYAGAAPQAVAGVFQVNVRIPESAASGDQQLLLTVGTCTSPAGVTVAVQ